MNPKLGPLWEHVHDNVEIKLIVSNAIINSSFCFGMIQTVVLLLFACDVIFAPRGCFFIKCRVYIDILSAFGWLPNHLTK